MTNYPAQRRAAETRALTIALAVAVKARWQLERAGLNLPVPFDAYFHVDAADLLVVPTSAPLRATCGEADAGTRLARSDALIVSTADAEPAFAIGMWTRRSTRWHVPVRPWLSDRGLLWMFATSGEVSPEFAHANITFPIRPGRLMQGFVPWTITAERVAGENRARAWLAEVMK